MSKRVAGDDVLSNMPADSSRPVRQKRRRPTETTDEIDLTADVSPGTMPTRASGSAAAPREANRRGGHWGELEDARASNRPSFRWPAPPPLPPHLPAAFGAAAGPPFVPEPAAGGSKPRRQRRQAREPSSPHRSRREQQRGWGGDGQSDNETDAALARLLQEDEDDVLTRRLEALEREEAAAAQGRSSSRHSKEHSARNRPGRNYASAAAAAGVAAAARARGEHPVLPPAPSAPTTTGPRSGRRSRWASAGSFADMMAEMLSAGFGDGGQERGGGGRRGGSGPYAALFGELAALHHAVSGAREGALPADLLFSSRDFTDADYEALCGLDEGVESRKGATQDVIDKAIPVVRVPRGGAAAASCSEHHGDQLPGDCTICLEACRGGESLRRLPCKHSFHKNCIDRWLRSKAVCPICQRPAL